MALDRSVSTAADIPVIPVRVHVVARHLKDVETALSKLPLNGLPKILTDDGETIDTARVVIDAVLELERTREVLLAFDPTHQRIK